MDAKICDIELRGLVKRIRIKTSDCENGLISFDQWLSGAIAGVQICALIIGESGTGKSVLLEMFVSKFKETRKESGLERRVVIVETPHSPTAISLLETLLEALDDPLPAKGTRTQKMARALKLLKDQGVLIVILDDLQHFVDMDQERVLYDASECLKEIMIKAKVSIIGAGLPDAKRVVNSNEQLKRRYVAPVHMNRYDWEVADMRHSFVGLLRAFQKPLSMFEMPKLDGREMSLRMYLATGGLIDFVAKILLQAVWDALDRKSRKISLRDLEKAWSKALWDADNLGDNPFDQKFRIDQDLPNKLSAAKRINQRVVRPVSKRSLRRSRLAAVGL